MRRKWESQYAGFADIDWANTKAYCYEVLTFPPGIWVNTRGQRPHGVVEPGAEYDRLLAELTEKLLALPDPVTGKPLVTRVYRKEEAYHGPYLQHAPDLTVSWWDGITFLTKPSFGEGAVVEYFGGKPLEAGDWGGGHALDGIVAMHGAPFREGNPLRARTSWTSRPRSCTCSGLPVPEDMDGRVLQEAFTGEFAAQHTVTTRPDARRSALGREDRRDLLRRRVRQGGRAPAGPRLHRVADVTDPHHRSRRRRPRTWSSPSWTRARFRTWAAS